jgi:hypothetical protein
MSLNMNVGGAFGSLMSGNPIDAFKKIFNEKPEENIREAVYDIREGKCTPEEGIRKIMGQLAEGGSNETLQQVQQLMMELQAGGNPEEIFQKIHELVDPKGADKTTNRISGSNAPAHRPGPSDIGY